MIEVSGLLSPLGLEEVVKVVDHVFGAGATAWINLKGVEIIHHISTNIKDIKDRRNTHSDTTEGEF
jgi:hypothetical protein